MHQARQRWRVPLVGEPEQVSRRWVSSKEAQTSEELLQLASQLVWGPA